MANNKMFNIVFLILINSVLIIRSHTLILDTSVSLPVFKDSYALKTTPNLSAEYDHLKTQPTNLIEKFFSVLGHRVVNSQNSPELYKTVTDLCEKLGMAVPYVTVFKGNVINSGLSKVFGIDFKANAFAISLIQKMGLISIGSDLIDKLSYDEIRSIIAHELSHIKSYHVIKKIASGIIITNIIENLTQKIVNNLILNQEDFNNPKIKNWILGVNLTAALTIKALEGKLSRIFEKEADLMAINLTRDKTGLITGLENIHKIAHDIYDRSLFAKVYNLFNSHPTNKERAEYLTLESAKLNIQ